MKLTRDQRRRIYNAARRSRRWAEKHAGYYGASNDLCGMCAVASVHLHRQLKHEGISAKIIAGDGHAYLTYKDYIIDVTATQFGKSRIVICRQVAKPPYYWQEKHIERTGLAFMKYQRKCGWSEDQIFGWNP